MDIAQIRRTNLLKLFSQFVASRQAEQPGVSLVGIDKAFSQLIQIDNTYFSRMKTGGRQVSNKLARQIEALTGQPKGWLDEEHEAQPSKGLKRFLDLAEKAYVASPASRKALTQAFKDAVNSAQA